MNKWVWVAVGVAMCAAMARGEWQVVGEITAGGAASTLALERDVRVVQIECLESPLRVETLWILEGEAENPVTVARDFQPGETQTIDLGYDRPVTGLRIQDQGEGKYKVSVK